MEEQSVRVWTETIIIPTYMDYSADLDISWYKNISVLTSYMAVRSNYNFVGGYKNDTNGGCFTWLMRYEEKAFNPYFMPYRDIGVDKNASKDARLNLEFDGGNSMVRVYITGTWSGSRILLESRELGTN